MVAISPVDPNLVPVPPEWLRRKEEESPSTANRNINGVYWRKPDGYIRVGPSAVRGADGRMLTAQAEGYVRRGWEPLVEYSYTDRVSPKTGQRETIEMNADRLNTPDKWYWLFKNGGAHLFSIEQIVELHWHITPPFGLPKTVFPQLDEWDVPEPYYCPACPGTRPPKNSIEQVTQHLMIEHRMTLMQVRDLQQGTSDFKNIPSGSEGLAIMRKARSYEAAAEPETEPTPKQVYTPETPEPSTSHLIVCDQCGAGPFKNGLEKGRHVKKEHPKD